MSHLYSSLRRAAALVAVGAALTGSAHAATITVNSANDTIANDGNCTLREAVRAANTNVAVDLCAAGDADGDVVLVSTVTSISLTGGEMLITDDVTVRGMGATRITIDGRGLSRIFDVNTGSGAGSVKRVQFLNLVLQNGNSGAGASSAPDAGGAVDLKAGSQATFTNVDVTGSVCGINGGGIHGAGMTDIVITTDTGGASIIRNNEARGAESNRGGGGVWGAGAVTISGNVLIDGNRATGAAGSGGGVFNLAGTLTVGAGVVISNNTANRAGGGIESADGTVAVTGATLRGNTAGTAPGNGGGFHGGGAVTATFSGGTVAANTAVEGGGLWISGAGTLTVTGTAVTGNTATGADADQGGGGVYNDGGTATLATATISGNKATGAAGSGGGILTKGALTVTGGTIATNTSMRAGGGIEVVAATGVVLNGAAVSGNTAGASPGFGGGVHITGAGNVTVTGGSYNTNTAVEGGGFWKAGPSTLAITGAAITGNTATGASADQGGAGLYNDGAGGMLTLTNATVVGNRASGTSGSGGGLLNNAGATTRVVGTTFRGNASNRAGGAIEDNAGGGLAIVRGTFSNNTTGSSPGNGGALHITGAGVVTMDSSFVDSNRAANQGGGLWNSGVGQLTVQYTMIHNNASGTGGGLYQVAGQTGLIWLANSAVTANSATAAGGGLAADGATIVVRNTTVSGNTAVNGGGIASGGGRFLVSNATIARNVASTNGGGLFRAVQAGDSSLISLDNSLVADNSAATGADAFGVLTSRGYNLFETTAGAVIRRTGAVGPDTTGVDPGLQPLGDNGGPTRTHAVTASSAAVGAGMTSLLIDQRGVARPTNSTIGAFEFGPRPVAGEDTPGTAAEFALGMAGPNPFRSRTTLRVSTPTSEAVDVVLFDALGRRVQSLYAGTPGAGATVDVVLDASALAPGLYLVRMTSASAAATQRVTVAR